MTANPLQRLAEKMEFQHKWKVYYKNIHQTPQFVEANTTSIDAGGSKFYTTDAILVAFFPHEEIQRICLVEIGGKEVDLVN